MNKLVYVIDSHNRLVESDSHSNFTFKINLPRLNVDDSKSLAVTCLRACVPRSYYLVNSTYGNTFVLQEDAKQATITIPYGNYNSSNFATTLTSLLNSNSPNGLTYSITFSSITGKYTYNVTGSATCSFTFAAKIGSGLHEQFGVSVSRTNATTYTLPFTSPNVVSFRLKDTLQVHSDICSAGKNDMLQDFVIAGQPNFSSIVYNSTESNMNARQLNTVSSNTYYLRITDEDGQIIDLNGVNCVITICIYQPIESLQRAYMIETLRQKNEN